MQWLQELDAVECVPPVERPVGHAVQSTLLRVDLYLPTGQPSHEPCAEYLPGLQLLTVQDLGPVEAVPGVVMCVGHVWHLRR